MIRILVHKKCLNTSIFFYSIYVEKQYNSIDKYRGSWGERVFWLNIAKFEINLCYRYCSNLFRNLRKESEFQQYHCRNSTKVGERKRKSGREKFLIFGNTITEIPSAHTCCPSGCSKCECAQGKPNVAMALPKQKKKIDNCGNAIAEIGRKKNSGCRNHM